MEITRVYRADAASARGIVIVIDVIRAFTVAAYALAGGAQRLWLVGTVDDARHLKSRDPTALLAGEIDGRLIPGFDLNNSPFNMLKSDVRARTIVQRTGAGTQGAVGATHATHLLVCSLVNAKATARHATRLSAHTGEGITLLPTNAPEETDCIEDDVCADYLEWLLRGMEEAADTLRSGIERLRGSGRLDVFTGDDSDFPAGDVPAFLAVDRFSFAMVGQRLIDGNVRYVEVTKQDVPEG